MHTSTLLCGLFIRLGNAHTDRHNLPVTLPEIVSSPVQKVLAAIRLNSYPMRTRKCTVY
jgi:hypothetical protein